MFLLMAVGDLLEKYPQSVLAKVLITIPESLPEGVKPWVSRVLCLLTHVRSETARYLSMEFPLQHFVRDMRDAYPLTTLVVLSLFMFVLALLLYYIVTIACKNRQPYMVVNRMTVEEFEKAGKEYTQKALAQLQSSEEWKAHAKKRGTALQNWNWQLRERAAALPPNEPKASPVA
uniref:Uncharacterized protein n=1 Tax=Chromera velia CCMP2878 TaxID=1169474 RepID=A0A0G4HPT7_9ALVE|eukprot:Cvel_7830.t1-p1 / transcript=Cvel_7830.t1 / gene=Cvel_7830 / organism=Chromera_velia_CCMP2878 / gene_product=hypothetical protein / transcript_product=hypothetical protein / location=Cvel_scaffold418:62803-64532(+) / protein_length=174 / sequence_SO=supercontig / SO=protein_coding / is_pseudo=false